MKRKAQEPEPGEHAGGLSGKMKLALGAAGLLLFIVGARKTYEWERDGRRARVTDADGGDANES